MRRPSCRNARYVFPLIATSMKCCVSPFMTFLRKNEGEGHEVAVLYLGTGAAKVRQIRALKDRDSLLVVRSFDDADWVMREDRRINRRPPARRTGIYQTGAGCPVQPCASVWR